MARFKHYDYNQTSMVVINYLDQLQPGTFSMPCITSFLKSWICPRFTSLIRMIAKAAQPTIQPFC
ncbi:hypothetical protein [Oceanospirillum sp.]|uniref:hypothetical protein n=1 Tax=Oceanospirillum sp. TaxID=2021254 RepID=UPI003A90B215